MGETQRHFSVMGDNVFRIADKLMSNQRLCRLLKYQSRTPFSTDLPDVDGSELLEKQILITPKIFDASVEKMSYVAFLYNSFSVNPFNPEFKDTIIRFVVACPYNEWVIEDRSLRPYLLMEEIDKMFNQSKLMGIGRLSFLRSNALVLSPQLSGFDMLYQINEFN